MDLGSEQSDVDMESVQALSSIGIQRFPYNELKSIDVPIKGPDLDKPNYSDIESLAEDNDDGHMIESSEEDVPMQTFHEPNLADYEAPLFTKTSGETILKLTELYTPLKSTQSVFDKLHLLERVCKTSSSMTDYYEYIRSLREYKTQLKELYSRVRQEEITGGEKEPVYSLAKPIEDYQKRYLVKRLNEVDREIKELEIEKKAQEKKSININIPKNSFVEIKQKDFTKEIVWNGPEKVSRKKGREKVAKIIEHNDVFKMEKQLAQKSKNLLYVNYNESEGPYLKKSVAFQPRDLIGAAFASLPMKRAPDPYLFSKQMITFGFARKKAKPGKLESSNFSKKESQQDENHWGEVSKTIDENQQDSDFQLNTSIKLFENSSNFQLSMIPTCVNPFFKKNDWEKLVFLDSNGEIFQSLKEEYGKLVYNLSDPHMDFSIQEEPEEAMEVDDDGGYFSDADSEHSIDENKTIRSDQDFPESRGRFSETSSRTGNVLGLPRGGMDNPFKSRFTMLKHALPAYDYPFTKVEWNKNELRNFHRPDLSLSLPKNKWKVNLVRTPPSSPGMEVKGENITAHAILKGHKQLTLKDGAFVVTEYIEKRPPLLNNYSMASKIRRYYKGNRPIEEYPDYIGSLGLPESLDNNESMPLIARLQENQGIAILENNLYRAPIYFHHSKSTDFIMMKYPKKSGKSKWYLRPIEYLYCSAQVEPKIEVFAPNARNTNNFQQKRIQAIILKCLIDKDNRADIHEIAQNFPAHNESIIRKQMKNIDCEQTSDGTWTCTNLPNEQEVKDMITPENMCQYESMLAGQRRLKDKGIKTTSIDKIPNAIQKLKKEMGNKNINYLADYIEEELTITPWNLTSSYLKTKNEKGMMRIVGIGDPTHGNCGYSFVRLPMKLPNIDKTYLKNDPSEYLPTNMTVTGTNADLRTLTKEDVIRALINLGCKKEEVEGLGRWDGVAKLRSVASRKVSEGHKGTFDKFARGIRMSTKMQKEQCQKTIDEIFAKQVRMLGETREYYEDRSSGSEDDKLARLMADSINKPIEDVERKRIDLDEDIERSDIKHLENLKTAAGMFTATNDPEVPTKSVEKRKILKRITRIPNPLDGTITVRTEFISDENELEQFIKKKKEEQNKPKGSKDRKKTYDTIEQKILFRASDHSKKKKKKEEDLDQEAKKREKQLLEEKKKLEKQQEWSKECIEKLESGQVPATGGAGKIVCGKCGMVGHMKTNRKKCPMFLDEAQDAFKAEKEGMVKMEGSKIKLFVEKIQKAAPKKKEENAIDEYSRPKTIPSRRRQYKEDNPYEDIAFKLTRFDQTKLFTHSVKKEMYPDYYELIKSPIDLSAMSTKAKQGKYTTAQLFIDDLELMLNNSVLYNGLYHDVTEQARELKEIGIKLLKEKELLVEIPKAEGTEAENAPQS